MWGNATLQPLFNSCFKGAAAEHRSWAQRSILQCPGLSEHPSSPYCWTNTSTKNCLGKQPFRNLDMSSNCGRFKAGGHNCLFCQPAQAEQQPPAKPPARPPPPTFPPLAASSTPTHAPPTGTPSHNPPPMAPPTQAQGPPYPSYQGYPGYDSHQPDFWQQWSS